MDRLTFPPRTSLSFLVFGLTVLGLATACSVTLETEPPMVSVDDSSTDPSGTETTNPDDAQGHLAVTDPADVDSPSGAGASPGDATDGRPPSVGGSTSSSSTGIGGAKADDEPSCPHAPGCGTDDCELTVACLVGCGENATCIEACFELASPDAVELAESVQACEADKGCEDIICTYEKCAEEYIACVPSADQGESCLDTWDCYSACPHTGCASACVDKIREIENFDFHALRSCVKSADCESDECRAEACKAEFAACE